MEHPYPYREISPWVERPADLQAPLSHDLDADVVVIGGGYTGLSTALSLREQGVDVVVLEQGFAGSGASGRNAGHLAPTIGKDVPTLLRFFGRERASQLVRFADAAVDYTEETIRKYDIDCDYRASGNVMAGVHPKHEDKLRKAASAAHELGADMRFLDGAEMRERGLPEAFRCGIHEERGGTLHPGRFVLGLRRAALAAGVRLFEDSGLLSLEDGARVVARTAAGSVRADFAVLATNAYTRSTGRRKRAVAPLRVSMLETVPLDDAQLEAIGWRGREGVYTAHEVLESFRLSAQNTIVVGTKVVRQGYGGALPSGNRPEAFAAIHAALRERLPALHDVEVAHAWGGWIALTPDFLPQIGAEGRNGNVLHGIGFCGHGVPQATLMGAMLACRIQGREHEWESALRRRSLSWPPEPLTWLGGTLLNAAFAAVDRRTDRQVRALSRD
ncbi:MAG: FAD-binding oxidoreductase [Myxococcota bacterium]|nr:FAD-binding oxidoreductase [Myxococcota bacterium]